MTTPFWCLLVAIFLPYVLSGTAAYYKKQQFGSVDNNHPRAQSAALEGAGARAVAAQANAWEALLVFGLAVVVAHLAGVDPADATLPCTIFIGARVLHGVCYIADLAPLRSLSFLVATVCCLWLFRLASTAA